MRTSLRRGVIAWFVIANVAQAIDLAQKIIRRVPLEGSDRYQILFPFATGMLVLALRKLRPPPYLPTRMSTGLRFAALFVVFGTIEVTVNMFLGEGVFKGATRPLAISFLIGLLGIGSWALGAYWAFRWFELTVFEACILGGLAGFVNEAILFQPLWREIPLWAFAGLLPPIAAWHYIVLDWLALEEIDPEIRIRPRSRSIWRYPIGLIAPSIIPSIFSRL